MRKVRLFIGKIIFWLGWPFLWLYFRKSVRTRVLIECDGQILAAKSIIGVGKWQLPGGGLHRGEDPIDGAIREVKEEVGLTLNRTQLQPLNNNQPKPHVTLQGLKYSYISYIVTLDRRPKLSAQKIEIEDITWLDPKSLSISNTSKDMMQIVDQWLSLR